MIIHSSVSYTLFDPFMLHNGTIKCYWLINTDNSNESTSDKRKIRRKILKKLLLFFYNYLI